MTIGELLKPLGTMDQYEVLQRADAWFTNAGDVGRYFGGQLSDFEVTHLTPVKPERKERT